MSKKIRPTQIDKEIYIRFKKYCIDNDLRIDETLEEAIEKFVEEGERNNE